MDRVLIIEDEEEVAKMIGRFLERNDFETDFAYTFDEGFKKIEDNYPIILLDINLAGKNSFPILEKAKKINPKNIVIMVTGNDNDENVKKARQLGAEGFIPKPIMLDFLQKFIVEKIKEIQQKRQFESP